MSKAKTDKKTDETPKTTETTETPEVTAKDATPVESDKADKAVKTGEKADAPLDEGKPATKKETSKPKTETAKPKTQSANANTLRDVDELIAEKGFPAWKGAALCRAEGWAPGKQVSATEFEGALKRFENRPIGG